jgi:hypothetical protein
LLLVVVLAVVAVQVKQAVVAVEVLEPVLEHLVVVLLPNQH